MFREPESINTSIPIGRTSDPWMKLNDNAIRTLTGRTILKVHDNLLVLDSGRNIRLEDDEISLLNEEEDEWIELSIMAS